MRWLDGITDSMDMLLLLLSRFSRVQLHDTMNCSLSGSSVHGIFQAKVLERVAIAFSAMDMSLSKLWELAMDRKACCAAVHGVTKRRARLSDFPFTFHFPALEKEMAAHSSILAWRISGTAQPGGLPSMESHRVGHD